MLHDLLPAKLVRCKPVKYLVLTAVLKTEVQHPRVATRRLVPLVKTRASIVDSRDVMDIGCCCHLVSDVLLNLPDRMLANR